MSKIIPWLKRQIQKAYNSIAFYPALMVLLYLFLSYFMIILDFSDPGKAIKSQLNWLRLKDASTARTVISVIAAGIFSLTVFSFTMVMVVLNQTASQMSNRILDQLIGNRFQQIVLGFYVGTIVYSLFLLSSIRDIDTGISIPSLSTFLLIAFAIVDIFLFIYFLHYITQSVKYRVIISRIKRQTKKAMKKSCRLDKYPGLMSIKEGSTLFAHSSGIFEGFIQQKLEQVACEQDCVFSFIHPRGSYILKNNPILHVYPESTRLPDAVRKEIEMAIFISEEESVENNFYYGFRQLTEVAVKALSPGINDPGTAVESLRALFELLAFRMDHHPDNTIKDKDGTVRIITKERSFGSIFRSTLLPIWDYGKNDRFMQKEMQHLLMQLQSQAPHPDISEMLAKTTQEIVAKD